MDTQRDGLNRWTAEGATPDSASICDWKRLRDNRQKRIKEREKEEAMMHKVHEVLLSTLPRGWKVAKRPPDPGEIPEAVR